MYVYIYIYQCECGPFKLPIIPHLSSPGIIIQLSETQGTTVLPETTPERRCIAKKCAGRGDDPT